MGMRLDSSKAGRRRGFGRARHAVVVFALLALACDAPNAVGPIAADVSREEFTQRPPGSYLILDVRTSQEYAAGHLDGALNISHDQLEAQLPGLRQYASVPVLLYCKSGKRAGKAAETLSKAGFTNLNHLEGDFDGWVAAGLPVIEDGP